MNKNKYVIALIGLVLGFVISFFLTQNYNKSNAAPPPARRSRECLAARVAPAANKR